MLRPRVLGAEHPQSGCRAWGSAPDAAVAASLEVAGWPERLHIMAWPFGPAGVLAGFRDPRRTRWPNGIWCRTAGDRMLDGTADAPYVPRLILVFSSRSAAAQRGSRAS